MKKLELLKVFIRRENGRTVCICLRSNKRCERRCIPDVVERDLYRDWERTMNRDRFGK